MKLYNKLFVFCSCCFFIIINLFIYSTENFDNNKFKRKIRNQIEKVSANNKKVWTASYNGNKNIPTFIIF